MKTKWITTAAVLALSTSLAIAAPERGEGKRGHGRHGRAGAHGFASERFAEKLNLTDAQKAQIAQLRATFKEQNRPYFDAAKATRQEFKAARQAGDTAKLDALKATMQTQRTQMTERRQAFHTQFLNVLTADQRARLETLKAEREAKRGERGERGQRRGKKQ
jgi:protein CpxP